MQSPNWREDIKPFFKKLWNTHGYEYEVYNPTAFENEIIDFISQLQKETIEQAIEVVGKDSDIRTATAASESEDTFDFGYDIKKKEDIEALKTLLH